MRTRLLLNVALALLVAGLLAVLIRDPWREPAEAPRRVSSLDPSAVRAVRVEPSGGTPPAGR